jgi:hypothetical protein
MESYAPAPTMMGATLSAAPVFTAPPMQPVADEEAVAKEEAAFKGVDYKKPGKTVKRHAGGQTWWDSSLAEWPENDFRVFVGDLGNEVNDDILSKAFQKYPSFAKGKVRLLALARGGGSRPYYVMCCWCQTAWRGIRFATDALGAGAAGGSRQALEQVQGLWVCELPREWRLRQGAEGDGGQVHRQQALQAPEELLAGAQCARKGQVGEG